MVKEKQMACATVLHFIEQKINASFGDIKFANKNEKTLPADLYAKLAFPRANIEILSELVTLATDAHCVGIERPKSQKILNRVNTKRKKLFDLLMPTESLLK